MMYKIRIFLQRETILTAACALAALSCFLVPPDAGYLEYIDIRTLMLLFCLMAVMAGMQEIGLFRLAGSRLLRNVRTGRGLAAILIFLCFFSSMLITNDVALITFVPFAILLLKMAGMTSLFCVTVTLMTIAANLGSMLTPLGNPQNLYLYTISGMSAGGFLLVMLPFTALSALLLLLGICLTYPRTALPQKVALPEEAMPQKKLLYYLLLFVLCLLGVLKVIPVGALLLILVIAILPVNKSLFGRVDYGLLLTFAAFFIFIGNMGRYPAFHDFLAGIVRGRERITAIAASQIISNVPAALLLSGFTDNWKELIIGANLGGLGTLIASMASLISYKQIARGFPGLRKCYLLQFTVWNVSFLAVFLVISAWF